MYFQVSSSEEGETVSSYFYKSGILTTLYETFTIMIDAYLPTPIVLIVKDDFFTSSNPDCVVILIDNLPSFTS